MSFVFNAAHQSPLPLRAAIWISLALFFLCGFTGSPLAQSGPGGYGPGGEGGSRHRGGGGDRHGLSRRDDGMPSLEALEGPPTPAIIRDSIGVDGEQLQRYARLYANQAAATQPLRDSLRTAMQAMRSGFENGDRSEVRGRREAVEQQWKELSRHDKTFDKAVKDVLTKQQLKRYDKWKETRDKAARERRHRERSTRGGAAEDGSPGRSLSRQSPVASRQSLVASR